MFHKDLLALEEQHQGQLKVLFTLTKPDNAGLKSLFKRKKDSWEGSKGRIDQSQLEEIIQKESMKEIQSSFYVCGPGNMIEEVKRSLMELGTDDSIIHTEYFSNPDQDQKDSGAQDTVSMESKLKVHLEGQDIETTMNSKMTVLDHLIDKGFDPPHSCTSGACSTCMAKIVSGTVEMEACFALDDKEVKAGYILTCQSHPTSPELEITFDV
jgi:ring-1,2-phenylacetyl-CoA epoxidase subunit PaaE